MLLRTGRRLPYRLGGACYIFHVKLDSNGEYLYANLSGIMLHNLLHWADIDLDQMEYVALMSVYLEDHTFIINQQKECR